VLFVKTGSLVGLDTATVFVMSDATAGVTETVSVIRLVTPSASELGLLQFTICPAAEQLHPVPVPEMKPKPVGKVSVTRIEAAAVEGPLFVTVIAYVPLMPTVKLPVCVLTMERSACGVSVSTSLALLLFGFGSIVPTGTVIVAVFVSKLVADAETVAVIVNVAVPLVAVKFTVVLILPLPFNVAQLEPVDAAQVQTGLISAEGIVSLTTAPTTGLGPVFVTTTVYVIACPGMAVVCPSVLLIERSATDVTVTVSDASLFASLISGMTLFGSTRVRLTSEPVIVGVTTIGTLNDPPDGKVTAPLAVQVKIFVAIAQLMVPDVPLAVVTVPEE
jgi:hypothetical protein